MFITFSALNTVLIAAAFISVPALIYLVGLLLPSKHTVRRTTTFQIDPEQLWEILTNVEQYPSWQSKVARVVADHKHSSKTRTTFVEHSYQKRSTSVTLVEQEHLRFLKRYLEEYPTTGRTRTYKPTFTGVWSIEIDSTDDKEVTLTIIEEGEITKPLVRVSHMFLSGFHHRVDRYLKDLTRKVEQERVTPARELSTSDMSASFAIEKEWDFMNETYDHGKIE